MLLTGKALRVRTVKNRIVPLYVTASDPPVRALADALIDAFRRSVGRSRAELAEEIDEWVSAGPTGALAAGLAAVLEGYCTFQTESVIPPEALRSQVFTTASRLWQDAAAQNRSFDRSAVLNLLQTQLPQQLTTDQIENALFADLKSEQRLAAFAEPTAERLIDRYNVALAQSVLLKSTRLELTLRGESPQRYRQLFRAIKFHRLIATAAPAAADQCVFRIDGPLSLFAATQKYGLQLALFLPVVLHCRNFEMQAQVRWGRSAQAAEKLFTLTHADGLRSHLPDHGMYVPPEVEAFAAAFRESAGQWLLVEEPSPLLVGGQWWVPDFRLRHRAYGYEIYLEFFGYWRRTDLQRHFEWLHKHVGDRFILCVSGSAGGSAGEREEAGPERPAIYRYRRMPLPQEVVRRAEQLAGGFLLG